jgi:hypothetical protein
LWAAALTNPRLATCLHQMASDIQRFTIPERNALLREAARRLNRTEDQ